MIECPYCSKTYKTERGFKAHLLKVHGELGMSGSLPVLWEPGPEEEQVMEGGPEPTAPDNMPREPEGERQEYIATPGEVHLMQQIEILSGNDQKIQEQLNRLQDNAYEAVSTAEGPGSAGSAGPSWSFDEFPEWLKEPAIKFLGDIGAAARSFAGGAPAELSVDELIIREAVNLTREETNKYIARKAANIARAMADPDLSVVALPKDEVDNIG